MSQTSVSSQSTWRSKIKAMGPGILMASAAVGGSHIVSSTQAGGSYGWALLGLVILANLFKYPFFRFGAEYTADTGKTLVEGYAEKGKFYLWVFFILNVFSALVNTAGVSILCSAIIASAFPMLGLSIPHGQSFWLPLSGVCYSLVVTNFLMVWLNGSCQL